MELGARLRQARLDAGLSQRQLCQDTITRNMLSQIENGSARPSMDTLRILAARLGKPIGYFLEEEAVLSPNLGLLEQIQSLSGQAVLDALKSYQSPDPVFDRERYVIEALTCLDLAETAVKDGKQRYAATLLEQAENAGKQTPYYTPEIQRRRQLLCFEAGMLPAEQLTPNPQDMLTFAKAALESGNADACHHLLALVQPQDANWHLLQGMAYLREGNYTLAAEHLLLAQPTNQAYSALETCYRELGNFEKAYFYACKQKATQTFIAYPQNGKNPARKPNRIPNYDYSQNGAYFITICTQDRCKILSSIVGDGFSVPKPWGIIAEKTIAQIPEKYPSVMVDNYVIMPDHIHILFRFNQEYGTGDPSPTLGDVIGWYKYQVTTQINSQTGTAGKQIFQRSYYDHVIRNQQDYNEIWEYIDNNPKRWAITKQGEDL